MIDHHFGNQLIIEIQNRLVIIDLKILVCLIQKDQINDLFIIILND